MNIVVTVPDWAHYKAQFSDGQWYLFETKPVYDGLGGWDNPLRGAMMEFMLESNNNDEDYDAEHSLTVLTEA